MPYDISLVICTRNRARRLSACLEAVGKLVFDGTWEIVLVDNGSTDDTRAVIEAFREKIPVPLVYVYEAVAGLGRARNSGIDAASGNLLCFTDDDCYPQADYLSAMWRLFGEESLGYAGGRILLFDPSDAPVTISLSTIERRFPPRSFIPAGTIQGANMAFTRAVLERIGGFDPDLGSGTPFACEDVDAVARASAAGFAGGYFPQPVVFHHHGRKIAEAKRLTKTYDIARGAYYAKQLGSSGGWKYAAAWLRAAAGRLLRVSVSGCTTSCFEAIGAWRYRSYCRAKLSRKSPST